MIDRRSTTIIPHLTAFSKVKDDCIVYSLLNMSKDRVLRMEFNYQMSGRKDITLFESIQERFEEAGYIMPKLIFWNVNSRSGAIPLTENEAGVILLSGFSKSLMEMVMSSELSPYKALVATLNKERYSIIDKIFA